jgi:alkylhydroperoxidase family enzyme
MPRIRPVEDSSLPPQEAAGPANMAELFRVMAHRPELAEQCMQLLETVMRNGSVEPQLKELLAVRVSQVNSCLY